MSYVICVEKRERERGIEREREERTCFGGLDRSIGIYGYWLFDIRRSAGPP